jgi:hypothetical protein
MTATRRNWTLGSGGYSSPQVFVDGLTPAMWVGVAALGVGALMVLLQLFCTPRAADVALAEQERGSSERESSMAEIPLVAFAGDSA